ncbi:hypothetical protein ECANGB1_1842 [Enterospora canceri]|uniref:Uncharacterized protein n=1 Tax=Enterospora canceri TaxID=1081671 RepID=A0A1Y1S5E9_9MICR|nr:hypothetical protein ECANGB1_1842 [Enterospora canceri]
MKVADGSDGSDNFDSREQNSTYSGNSEDESSRTDENKKRIRKLFSIHRQIDELEEEYKIKELLQQKLDKITLNGSQYHAPENDVGDKVLEKEEEIEENLEKYMDIEEDAIKDKKGRFIIEKVKKQVGDSQKGRFRVTSGHEGSSKTESDSGCNISQIYRMVEMQNKQIDILFDMINNVSGNDKLFQKEFIELAKKMDEGLSNMKKQIKKKRVNSKM